MTNIFLGCASMKNIKKFISVFLSVTIAVSIFVINANAVWMGNIGVNETNIVWSLDETTGILTVNGSGRMKNMNSSNGLVEKQNILNKLLLQEILKTLVHICLVFVPH